LGSDPTRSQQIQHLPLIPANAGTQIDERGG